MQQYHDLLQKILDEGDIVDNERTGTGTQAIFGENLKFDLRNGFPAVTTKKLAWRGVVSELIWFLRGSSNVHELREILHGKENRMNWSKKTIWDANYQEQAVDLGYVNGEMGDIYGVQWRNFGKETLVLEDESCKVTTYDDFPISGVDQVRLVINEAKKNPGSRRLIINAWNPKVIWGYNDDYVTVNQAALPPCHMMFQLRITNGELDLLWYQRSVDTFLGLPFNIASYGLLLHIFARILNLKPRNLVASLGDTHIYSNHVDQVKEQLTRKEFPAPELWINPDLQTLEDFENASVDDFKLIGYEHHQAIKAEMAV